MAFRLEGERGTNRFGILLSVLPRSLTIMWGDWEPDDEGDD